MNLQIPAATAQSAGLPPLPGCKVTDLSLAELVAEVFVAAPPRERGLLIELLLRPLGLLSLFGVAGGIFARLRLRSGWHALHLDLKGLQTVQADDVIALFDHAQQISVDAVDGLAQLLSTTPVLAGSAAAALLVAVLAQRAQGRTRTEAATPAVHRAGH